MNVDLYVMLKYMCVFVWMEMGMCMWECGLWLRIDSWECVCDECGWMCMWECGWMCMLMVENVYERIWCVWNMLFCNLWELTKKSRQFLTTLETHMSDDYQWAIGHKCKNSNGLLVAVRHTNNLCLTVCMQPSSIIALCLTAVIHVVGHNPVGPTGCHYGHQWL